LRRALLIVFVALAALIGSAPARADIPAPGDFSPAIWSDKADYSPGEHVVLSGTNWSAGESCMDRQRRRGQHMERTVDVTADAAGTSRTSSICQLVHCAVHRES